MVGHQPLLNASCETSWEQEATRRKRWAGYGIGKSAKVGGATELKDELRQSIDDRDPIVVTEIGAEWASRRALANLGEM